MAKTIAHRTYVSYIDKSRNYYAAQGFDVPYAWASHQDAPFAPLSKPLNECRIGIVSTADKAPIDAPRATKQFAAPLSEATSLKTDKFWDRDATHTDDPETYLPVNRVAELVEAGVIGSLSPRFYAPATDYSARKTITEDAPEIERWMREDEVDVALLVPL